MSEDAARDPSTLSTLDSFLAEEGILLETTVAAKVRVTALKLMAQFLDAQLPDGTWELDKLIAFKRDAADHLIATYAADKRCDENIHLAKTILAARIHDQGFNVIGLDKYANKTRTYLGLSVTVAN